MAVVKRKRKGDSVIRDGLILIGIILVVGTIVFGVYSITQKPINEAKVAAENTAFHYVFPEAKEFGDVADTTNVKWKISNEIAEITEAKVAYDQKKQPMGHVYLVTAKKGHSGNIEMALGISKEGEVKGVQILSMKENVRYAKKCAEKEFKDQFKGIRSDYIQLVKGKVVNDNQVSVVSGATTTSQAITDGINQVIKVDKQWKTH